MLYLIMLANYAAIHYYSIKVKILRKGKTFLEYEVFFKVALKDILQCALTLYHKYNFYYNRVEAYKEAYKAKMK